MFLGNTILNVAVDLKTKCKRVPASVWGLTELGIYYYFSKSNKGDEWEKGSFFLHSPSAPSKVAPSAPAAHTPATTQTHQPTGNTGWRGQARGTQQPVWTPWMDNLQRLLHVLGV